MNWKESLDKHKTSLNNLKTYLENIEYFINYTSMFDNLVFTGIGKNYFVAKSTASTFNSLGIRAKAVHPVDCLHGDLGQFRVYDLIIPISKSGETEEILDLVIKCKNLGLCVASFHANEGCRLARFSDISLYVEVGREADDFDLVPTASIVCFLSLLQSIGVDIASRRGLDKKSFISTHPGGNIGNQTVA